MQQSEQINELMGALAKAQSEMSFAVKDNNNPYFKSTYADLGGVWDACRKPLSKHGLAVAQVVTTEGDKPMLVTLLGHSSGQWVKSLMQLPIQKPGPQEIGSCITYCRRYALAAMVGVYQDDDDAEAAQKPYREAQGHKGSEPAAASAGITDKQYDYLMGMIQKVGDGAMHHEILGMFNIKTLRDIPKERFNDVLAKFSKNLEENKSKEKQHVRAAS